MRLGTQISSFVFNLPTTFIPEELNIQYSKILKKNHIPYNSVIDYLNSTIKSITIPGLSVKIIEDQKMMYGKTILHKPATNAQDIVSSNEVNITFLSKDSDLNYFLMRDIFYKHYMDTKNTNLIDKFIIYNVDSYREVIFEIIFDGIVLQSITDNMLDYSAQRMNAKEFTLSFKFTIMNTIFSFDQSKQIDLKYLPVIINIK